MTREQEIIQKYKLNDSQLNAVTETIISTLSHNKSPSKNPIAIVVGGQPGSGKTALINFTKQISSARNFITIDNDFFRNFHPQASEIKANFPNLFREATDQCGMEITSSVIDYFSEHNFDVILHQTLKNNRIGDDAISNLRDKGYTIGVRVFAVPFYESSMSQIERYLGQAEALGYCRYATQDGHSTAYLGLPNTVEYLEKNGLYDFLQVYKRSDDIANPTVVYTKINPQTADKTLLALENCENGPKQTQRNGFYDAKDAVLKTRYQDAIELSQNIGSRIEEAQSSPYNNPNIQSRIDELNNSLLVVKASQDLSMQAKIAKSMPAYNQSLDVANYITQVEFANANPVSSLSIPRISIESLQTQTDTSQ